MDQQLNSNAFYVLPKMYNKTLFYQLSTWFSMKLSLSCNTNENRYIVTLNYACFLINLVEQHFIHLLLIETVQYIYVV